MKTTKGYWEGTDFIFVINNEDVQFHNAPQDHTDKFHAENDQGNLSGYDDGEIIEL